MDGDSNNATFRQQQLRQYPPNPPPVTTLPSIPQLPPITLASSPSVESFTTALSSASSQRRPSLVENSVYSSSNTAPLSVTPPASPSSSLHPRPIRATVSVQHLRSQPQSISPPDLRWQSEVSDFSDFEVGSNRTTPVPSNYRGTQQQPPTANYGSDKGYGRRWESDRDEPYFSTASTARGGTMSDSHTPSSRPISKSTSATTYQRIHAYSNAAASSSSSSFFGAKAASSSSGRRDITPVPPISTVSPPTKPPSNPSSPSAPRLVGRARSASLLGMVSSVANSKEPSRSAATAQQPLQKPRLTIRPANTPPASGPNTPGIPDITLLIVGSPKCGKSFFISKGLKSWGLQESRTVGLGSYQTSTLVPSSFAATFGGPGTSFQSAGGVATHVSSVEIQATSRMASVGIKNSTYQIETLEVGSQELFLAGPAWPAVIANGHWDANQGNVAAGVQAGVSAAMGLSPPTHPGARGRVIDGLIVCYDASDAQSWDFAKLLLGHASQAYLNQPIQAFVVACKTDLLDPPVPADHTRYHPLLSGQSAEADQYQVGMPETKRHGHRRQGSSDDGHTLETDSKRPSSSVSLVHKNLGLVPVSRTEVGKKKMRDSFSWLLRRVERARRHHRANLAAATAAAATTHPAPTPPSSTISTTDVQQPYWPAPIGNSTLPSSTVPPPTERLKRISAGGISSASPGSGSAPMSPLSLLSSPESGNVQLNVNISGPPPPKGTRSPTSPTRARSTSDLTSDYARSGKERKEDMDKEYAAIAAAAAARLSSPPNSGTERERGSLGRKAASNAMRARADSVGAPLSSPSAPGVPPTAPPPIAATQPSGSRSARPSLTGSVKAPEVESGDGSRRGSGTTPNGAGGDGSTVPRGASITVSMLPMKTPKEPPPLQYATLDELLDKLVFLSVTDDDPVFVEQFLLVYRRFATPRSVLLGLQRRMRELSASAEDTLLAKFAQMSMCSLLETWMRAYPGDFAAPGAKPALQALVRQILSHGHTAHYGSDFVPFLEIVPDLVDEEKAWALKEEWRHHDDDGASEVEPDPEAQEALQVARTVSVSIAVLGGEKSADSLVDKKSRPETNGTPPSKPSPSLNGSTTKAKSTTSHSYPPVPLFGDYNASRGLRGPDVPAGTRPNLKDLSKASINLTHQQPHHVAEEITRLEVPLFLAVQPRDWLRHGLGEKGSEGFPDSITRMAKFYNYLTMWTASLILVNDKPRARAKTIDFFIRVAMVLRKLNNYSGLRAVVSGISMSRTDRENDPVMMYIRERTIWKKEFKSLETLLGTSRMHSAYRMALKHTFDAAIPSMEVHTYDLIRADDTNPDTKPEDPMQIHWGKFSLIAKMILNVVMYQNRFNDTTAFKFVERSEIRELIMGIIIMDEDTLYSRITLPAESHSGPMSDTGGGTSRFRQIFVRRVQ